MAKLVSVCFRTPPADPAQVARSLSAFLRAICPDNLTPRPPEIWSDAHGFFLGVLNPVDEHCVREGGACTGWLMNRRDDWWKPGTETPEGAFAMVRSSRDTVEALEDYAGSRTLWIAGTDECFIASSSQRAIPWFLESFEPNPAAAAWMLSSGLLGPGEGWDRRARPLGPGGRAILDRHSWRLAVDIPEVELAIDDVPHEAHVARLRSALERTVADLDLPHRGWLLTLSGGFDSRAILLLSRKLPGLECLTWDQPGALETPGTEAYTAAATARYLGVPYRVVELAVSAEPLASLVDRFLVAGEGRNDRIGGYMDGLRLWQSLCDEGTPGIIRGDHGLGWGAAPTSPEEVRCTIGLGRWHDYALPALASLDLERLDCQPLPAWAELREGESLGDFRDRLYHRFRIPFFTAALTDVKAAYCEIANPLLVKSIHSLQRGHPEPLRAGKALFRAVMQPLEIPVPYARKPLASSSAPLFSAPRTGEFLRDELDSRELRQLLSGRFVDYVLKKIGTTPGASAAPLGKSSQIRRLKAMLPKSFRKAVRKHRGPGPVPPQLLALRAVIVARMTKLMETDARQAQHVFELPAPTSTLVSPPTGAPLYQTPCG